MKGKKGIAALLAVWFGANLSPYIVVFVATGKVYYQLAPLWQFVAESSILHPLCKQADEIGVMFLQVLSMDVTEKWYSLVDAISLWVLALVAAGIWMSTARHDTAKQGRDTKKE